MTDLANGFAFRSRVPLGSGAGDTAVIPGELKEPGTGAPPRAVIIKVSKYGSADQLLNEVNKVRYLCGQNAALQQCIVGTRGLYELWAEGSLSVGLVLDYMPGGSLRDHIPAGGILETQAADIFRQLFTALTIFDELRLVHRDLKPSSIFCSQDPSSGGLVARIAGFGFATFLDEDTRLSYSCGTPGYLAPEMRGPNPRVSSKADCFALGATLLEAVTGRRPSTPASFENLGFHGDVSDVSAQLLDLLARLGAVDPAARPAARVVLAHPWFSTRPRSPAGRGQTTWQHPWFKRLS
jgi:serine/threonine protein kinase